MYSDLKQLRLNNKLTQKQCSEYLRIPITTLRNWEQGIRKPGIGILDIVLDKLMDYNRETNSIISEESGILSFLQIKEKVKLVAQQYNINSVYLFGSYALGIPNEMSDIDLYMDSNIGGLEYFGLIEDFRVNLKKGVDLLSTKTVIEGSKVFNEIQKTGILIYGKQRLY